MIILLYVDDILLAEDNKDTITWMKKDLDQCLQMWYLGESRTVVGLKFGSDSNKRTLWLFQPIFVKFFFNSLECKIVTRLINQW